MVAVRLTIPIQFTLLPCSVDNTQEIQTALRDLFIAATWESLLMENSNTHTKSRVELYPSLPLNRA